MGNRFWQNRASSSSTSRAERQEYSSTAAIMSSRLMQEFALPRVKWAAACRRCLTSLESCSLGRSSAKRWPYLLRTAQASGMNTSFLVPGRVQVLTIVFKALATSSITLGPTVMLVR